MRNDQPPKPIRFSTFTAPQIGDELSTNLEDREITVRVKKRTFVFLDAEEDPSNVSIRLDVEEIS